MSKSRPKDFKYKVSIFESKEKFDNDFQGKDYTRLKWLFDNIGPCVGANGITPVWDSDISYPGKTDGLSIDFYFKHEKDAVWFALNWT